MTVFCILKFEFTSTYFPFSPYYDLHRYFQKSPELGHSPARVVNLLKLC